jgi:serine/threonine protein kinase
MEHEERLRAALADRYPIDRELGSGGMATVYLAKDLRHERDVAVKVFQPELAAALGSERFLREIKITAGLSHPHILPLLDSGEADSFLYYVMPYVDGESLRERLDQERELVVDEAVRVTEQVASALTFAHSRGIVHRDLKPENILLQSGHVVVADFGIALAFDSAGGTRLTETGLSIGTPAYMSPEQVAGEEGIDARSDIYSLGCMLYEMLAGDPPFIASHPRAVLAKHLTDPAPPVTTVRPGVPPPVATTISKALEKAPADRFESASAFATALTSKLVVEEGGQEKSIVVLPFANLSPDPDNAFFADGLTEELIADLSKIKALKVISRTSAMSFQGSNKTVPAIAEELNVRYALEGSVRRFGDNLRITAKLIDTRTDDHLWAEKYSGTLEDVFDMQERTSRAIVEALQVEINPGELKKIAERPIDDVQAYECYLRARNEIHKGTAESLESALRHLEAGLKMVGENELLYQGMAELHLQSYEYGVKADEETLQQAEAFSAKVMALRPDSASSHYLRGRIEGLVGGRLKAVHHLERTLEIDPNHPGALLFLLTSYTNQVGRPSAADTLAERLVAVDPLSPLAMLVLGWHHWMSGRFEEALSTFDRILELEPSFLFATVAGRALVLLWQDRRDKALEVLAPVSRRDPRDLFADWAILLNCALAGDSVGAVEAFSEDTKNWAWNDPECPYFVASAFALGGAKEEALKWLERAVERGWINYPLLARQDPLLKSIRDEERFKELMVRVKQEWEAFGT